MLYTVLEILKEVTVHMYPFTPKLATSMWSQLGYELELDEIESAEPTGKVADPVSKVIKPGQKIKRAVPGL